jgi:hypothetical protein
MAPFVPVPKVVRVSFSTTSATFKGGWRIFFQYGSSPPAAADCQALASACASQWQANLATLTHHNLTLSQVLVQDLNSDTWNVGVSTLSSAGTRTSADAMPADVCTLIVHHVTRHYRGGKPRTYAPFGVIEDLATVKAWTTAFQGAVQAGWGSFINGIIGTPGVFTSLNHVNVSYKSGSVPNTSGSKWAPKEIPAPRTGGPLVEGIVAHTVNIIPGSQRRRLHTT